MRLAPGLLAASLALLFAASARAETWSAPVGGRPLALGEGRVACKGPLEAGWTSDPEGKSIAPPATRDSIGKVVAVKVAATQAACAASSAVLSVVAIGPRPTVDEVDVASRPPQDRALELVTLDEDAPAVHGPLLRLHREVPQGPGAAPLDLHHDARVVHAADDGGGRDRDRAPLQGNDDAGGRVGWAPGAQRNVGAELEMHVELVVRAALSAHDQVPPLEAARRVDAGDRGDGLRGARA
jgi:hypothetical protein